mmetsp:Transcript_19643/g.47415  ORF Transcript_19643/g.47415 Transcript_19643/m.47415 type:complete len:254 (-) Transcript_19643:1330-2091(-)
MSQPIHPQHQRPPLPGQQSHQNHDPERQRRDRRTRQERTATSSSSRRPNPKSSGGRGRTIPSLLRYMEGLEVVAELKTGRRIQGILVVAEDDMNITLEVPSSSSPSFVMKKQEEQERGRLSSETEPTARSDGEIRHSQSAEYDTHGNTTNTNSSGNSHTIFDIYRGGFLNDATGDGDDESDHSPAAAAATTSSSVENNNNNTNIKNEKVNIHIRGSEVRYIQFPDNVQPSKIVSVGKERERLAAKKYQKTMRR